MPTSLPIRKTATKTSSEHFGFKVALVASALVLFSFVAAIAELQIAGPGYSLAEFEMAQQMAKR